MFYAIVKQIYIYIYIYTFIKFIRYLKIYFNLKKLEMRFNFVLYRHFVDGNDENNWIGPPHNADMSTQTVTINADMTCGNGWVGTA